MAKSESGNPPQKINGRGYPIYLLLGSSDGVKGVEGIEDAEGNVLDKQKNMMKFFERTERGANGGGMRGIWFNTISLVRDIHVYSNEIWVEENLNRREALWLNGAARQNVASIDFLNEDKGRYIVKKNADYNENWNL